MAKLKNNEDFREEIFLWTGTSDRCSGTGRKQWNACRIWIWGDYASEIMSTRRSVWNFERAFKVLFNVTVRSRIRGVRRWWESVSYNDYVRLKLCKCGRKRETNNWKINENVVKNPARRIYFSRILPMRNHVTKWHEKNWRAIREKQQGRITRMIQTTLSYTCTYKDNYFISSAWRAPKDKINKYLMPYETTRNNNICIVK